MAKAKDKPFWFEKPAEIKRFPSLQGRAETDVLVIGGGIVGILTAWQLHQEGVDCILLDKQHLTTESTGYTTALISRSPDIIYHQSIRKFGLGKVTEFLDEMAESQKFLRHLAKTLRIPCDWKDCRSFFFSHKPSKEMEIECEAILTTGQAREITKIEREAVPAGFPFGKAVVFDNEAHYHPRKFLWGLMGTAKRMQVYEDSEVKSLKTGNRTIEANLEDGTIEARQVILAGRTDLVPHLLEKFTKKKTYLLQLKFRKEAPFTDDLFWDNAIPYNYFRRIDAQNILLGGRDRERSNDARKQKAFEELKNLATKLWPGHKFDVARQWQGTIFETPDMFPCIGPDPKNPRTILAAQGFAGVGMVMGALASRMLVAAVRGDKMPLSRFLSFSR